MTKQLDSDQRNANALASVLAHGLSPAALKPLLAPQATFLSAHFEPPQQGPDRVAELLPRELGAWGEPRLLRSFSRPREEAVLLEWEIPAPGGDRRTVQGILLAISDGEGRIEELRHFLRPAPVVALGREAARARYGNAVDAALWRTPETGTDDGLMKPLKKTFPWAEDIVFNSPVLLKPVAGRESVERVLQHAGSVYGVRNYEDRKLAGENGETLMFWSGEVNGHPLHTANIFRFTAAKECVSITAFGRPFAPSKALFDFVRVRLAGVLSAAYFDFSAAR